MPQIIVRKAIAKDAALIQALYQELVNNPSISVSSERIGEVSQDRNTALFVGEIEGVVAGTVLVSLCLDVMFGGQPFAVIENIIVASAYRGAGIGLALMQEAESYCKAAQCSKIMLLSSAERTEAHRFFEKAGFAGSKKKGFVKYRRQFSADRSENW